MLATSRYREAARLSQISLSSTSILWNSAAVGFTIQAPDGSWIRTVHAPRHEIDHGACRSDRMLDEEQLGGALMHGGQSRRTGDDGAPRSETSLRIASVQRFALEWHPRSSRDRV
jgi:hypothetical protein